MIRTWKYDDLLLKIFTGNKLNMKNYRETAICLGYKVANEITILLILVTHLIAFRSSNLWGVWYLAVSRDPFVIVYFICCLFIR